MKWWPQRPLLDVAKGERVLAWAMAEVVGDADRVTIGGTRDALYLPGRVPWEQVKAADWDQDAGVLRVSEVGEWGRPRTMYQFSVTEPGRLLQLVRERISASVVLQRHVSIIGKRGVRVIARRPPGRSLEVAWFFEYDEGVDPDDPDVIEAADEALRVAQADIFPS